MSSDESTDKECPLCMEAFDFDDLNFYPCTCQYQICRFCWHRLRTDENGLCPACRQPYPENPVNYQPVSGSELQKIKSKSKMANKSGKVKSADGRKHLANYRVLQKNLVYVVGLSQKLAEVDVLKKPEFFGKFGRILKVVVGTTSIPQNVGQITSCTAYVTYARDDDALRAIEAVNNAVLDGRLLKASLGTTKYCSTFLRGQTCHKAVGGKMDCMYLHKIAEPDASFTKEDMHAGKHTEFERKLHEQLAERSTTVTQKRRVASEDEKSTEAKKPDIEAIVDGENNVSESETNSSEPDNSSLTMETETIAAEEISPQQTSAEPNILQSIHNNTTQLENIPPSVYSATVPANLRHSPTPPSPSLFRSLNTTQQPSIANKFTTCEEFERMLIMESKEDDSMGTTDTSSQCNGTSHKPNINFDDDLGFDPFSESIKGLADLVIEEQESRKQQQQIQQQQTQQNLNFLFNRLQPTQQIIPSALPSTLSQPPIQRPPVVQSETSRLYNSYLHQNTYMRYNQLRDYAKSALNVASGWPMGPPPPGLAHAAAIGSPAGNGFFSQK